MKKCTKCGIEKKLTEFHKNGKWYRGRCKVCHNEKFQPRTGKLNSGRFTKGHKPQNPFKKGMVSWNKGKTYGQSRNCNKYKIWKNLILEKCNKKCVKCESEKRLHVHHIVPWKVDKKLRFEISNGIVLCVFCHAKEDKAQRKNSGLKTRFKKGYSKIPWNKGKKKVV